MKYINYLKSLFWLFSLVYLLVSIYFGLSILLNCILLYLLIYKGFDIFLNLLIKDKEKLTNYKLVLISFLVSFIFSEIGLRNLTYKYSTYLEKSGFMTYVSSYNSNSYIWYKYIALKPNRNLHIRTPFTETKLEVVEFGYSHDYNYLGLRGEAPEINDSTYLLVTLGDSFTEGYGAPVDSTWANLLTKNILANKNKNIKLLNAGIGGSDVFYEYYKLKNHLLPNYEPNEIIIAVNSSDINDTILKGGMERFSGRKSANIAPWWEPLYGISFLFRAVIHDVFKIDWHLMSEDKYEDIKEQSLDSICECLKNDYKKISEKHNFKYRVVFHPNIWELEEDDNIFDNCSKELNEIGVENVNLFSSFKKLENPKEHFWAIDSHNNSKGYEYWAKELFGNWDFQE